MAFFYWLSFFVTYLSGRWLISSSVHLVITPVPVSALEVFSLLYTILKCCICMFLYLCIFLLQCYTTCDGDRQLPVQSNDFSAWKLRCHFFWNAVPGWSKQSGAPERDWGWPGPLPCWAWPWDGVALDQLWSNWYWKNASPKKTKMALFVEKAMLFLNPLNWRNLSQNISK